MIDCTHTFRYERRAASPAAECRLETSVDKRAVRKRGAPAAQRRLLRGINVFAARRRGLPTADALRAAFREVGNALTYTTLILVLGFAVLAFSQFTPNSMMGKLASVMIALAWVADFIVTPALISYLPDPNRGTAPAAAPVPDTPDMPALT